LQLLARALREGRLKQLRQLDLAQNGVTCESLMELARARHPFTVLKVGKITADDLGHIIITEAPVHGPEGGQGYWI
jgi:hypothetical protein